VAWGDVTAKFVHDDSGRLSLGETAGVAVSVQ
jgi:hypothetical protein